MEILRPLIVLFAFCCLLISITYIFRFAFNHERRLSLLQAFVAVGGILWFITELMSIFNAITFMGLVVSWGIVFLFAVTILLKVSGGNLKNALFADLREIHTCLISLPWGLLAVILLMLVAALVLGLIAFAAAPNTWDSMTYHLSRVMHWQQNQSLSFYPTSISRQLHLGPLSEMFILNFQVLAGNDRLANFVQFFAMIGCVLGVSLITKFLGGNIHAQVLSSVACMTLPMGILQSTSTQNDYVVSLWLVCFVGLMLAQMQKENISLLLSILAGISLGLAILTKVTVLIFGASFGLWLAVWLILRFKAKAWKQMTIFLLVLFVFITPHSIRNYKLYGNPLGPMSESGRVEYIYTNEHYGFLAFTSNLLRNIALHLALPYEYFNDRVYGAVWRAHWHLGMDIDDPGTTWTGVEFRVTYSTNENLAGNPLHLILSLISMLVLLTRYRRSQVIVFALCLVAGLFLFSWFLKWQPWHSRLHLPLFVLAMSLVGVTFSGRRSKWILYGIVLILSVFSLKYVFSNPTRPMLGEKSVLVTDRTSQYFHELPALFGQYQQLSEAIVDLQCDDVALRTEIDDWEYPLWVMTDAHDRGIRFEHIMVENPSGMLDNGFSPCAIVTTYPLQEQTLDYRDRIFVKTLGTDHLSLFAIQSR